MMKNFRFTSWIGLAFIFLFLLNICLVIAGLLGDSLFMVAAIMLSCFQVYLHRQFQRKSNVLKNHPFMLKARRFFADIYSKFIIAVFKRKLPLNKKQREIIARRSKNMDSEVVNTNLTNPDAAGFEYLQAITGFSNHKRMSLRIDIGSDQCSRPYSLSVLNWGITRHSEKLVHAISQGANMGGCAVNTGENGLTAQLVRGGGDLVWRIRYNDCSLRNEDRYFNESLISSIAVKPYIKMIEVEFPLENVAAGKKGVTAFAMFSFVRMLRVLSGGKPIGINLYNPDKDVMSFIAESMAVTGIYFDFLTISGASPGINPSFRKQDEQAFFDAIVMARSITDQYQLRTKIIAAGLMVTEYDILKIIALGAHACFCMGNIPFTRNGFLNSLSLRNSSNNHSVKVANFYRNTINATRQLMAMCLYETLEEVNPADFYITTDTRHIKTLEEVIHKGQIILNDAMYVNLN